MVNEEEPKAFPCSPRFFASSILHTVCAKFEMPNPWIIRRQYDTMEPLTPTRPLLGSIR